MLPRIYPIILLSIFSVTTQAGFLQSDEGFSTIDYIFFSFNSQAIPYFPIPGDLTTVAPIPDDFSRNFARIEAYAPPSDTYAGSNPDGIIDPDLDFNIYLDDGTFNSLIYQNNGVSDTGQAIASGVYNFIVRNPGASLPAGNTPSFLFDTRYVAVIGAHSLAVGQPEPFHTHADERLDTLGGGILYEFNLSTDLDGIFSTSCLVQGQLDGSYVDSIYGDCNLSPFGINQSNTDPNQSVSAPASIWNVLPGIIGLLFVSLRKKNGYQRRDILHNCPGLG